MQTAKRRRIRWAIAASGLAHAGLLAAALMHRPQLSSPVELAAGPPETVIPVILTPRRPSAAAAARQEDAGQRARAARLPPTVASPAPPQALAAKAPPAGSAPPGPAQAAEEAPDLRLALRHGAAGCANAAAVGMTPAERERCQDRLGADAKAAPVMALAMEPRMRAYYDAVVKAKAPDKPWTPRQAIGALGPLDHDVRGSNDHIPEFGCVVPFGAGKKPTHKQMLPHALWLGPCFIEPPKGPLDPEVDIPVP
jgi:hypothetical protein